MYFLSWALTLCTFLYMPLIRLDTYLLFVCWLLLLASRGTWEVNKLILGWIFKLPLMYNHQSINCHFWKLEGNCWKVIRTLHDCPSQMNENLLISNSKLTSDSELIWWRYWTNLSSFVRDSHVGCVLYNGKDNHYQIRSWIQIMRNFRVLSNHERALLAHPCTFGEKIARFRISWF